MKTNATLELEGQLVYKIENGDPVDPPLNAPMVMIRYFSSAAMMNLTNHLLGLAS